MEILTGHRRVPRIILVDDGCLCIKASSCGPDCLVPLAVLPQDWIPALDSIEFTMDIYILIAGLSQRNSTVTVGIEHHLFAPGPHVNQDDPDLMMPRVVLDSGQYSLLTSLPVSYLSVAVS